MAASETGETKCGEKPTTGKDGGVSAEETEAANACHSFWDEAGREAGAKGD
jgi:hypothetical protein